MLVRSSDGTVFATGAATYNDAPDIATSSQIILQVEIGGFPTEAFVDTNSQYVVCTPDVAEAIGINVGNARFEFDDEIRISGILVRGKVYSGVEVVFFAEAGRGESLAVESYAFIVDEDAPLFTDELPTSSIGFSGCLESVCFAIDGGKRLFYFG